MTVLYNVTLSEVETSPSVINQRDSSTDAQNDRGKGVQNDRGKGVQNDRGQIMEQQGKYV